MIMTYFGFAILITLLLVDNYSNALSLLFLGHLIIGIINDFNFYSVLFGNWKHVSHCQWISISYFLCVFLSSRANSLFMLFFHWISHVLTLAIRDCVILCISFDLWTKCYMWVIAFHELFFMVRKVLASLLFVFYLFIFFKIFILFISILIMID